MKPTMRSCVAVLVLVVLAATAAAFINPNRTPKDMQRQSDVVLELEFKKVNDDGKAVAAVKKVLKGKFDKKEVTLDLLAGAFEQQGRNVMAVIKGGQKQAVMYIGKFPDESEQGMAEEPKEKAFLHMACPASSKWQWIELAKYEADVWDLVKQDAYMLGTWAGGTDMLLRLIDYIKSDPDADVPVREDAEWDKQIKAGQIQGKVIAAEPVDLAGDGNCYLFVAGAGGDHLFRFTGKAFEDVAAKLSLASKSAAFAWGDFSGDGKVDLASWDGKQLRLFSQKPDGTFQAQACDTGGALKDGCLALAMLDSGSKGRPALLASTKASPILLVPQADGAMQATPLVKGDFPGKELGEPSRCLVGDIDGDGLADVLQLFAAGSLLYKGKAPGEFAAPVLTPVAAGQGRNGACLGDWDGDGLLDVMTTAEDRNHLWQNHGKDKFNDLLCLTGEIAYISKPGGTYVQAGDVNNDGRQDILIAYGAQMAPQLFFNRGFRSTGHARQMDLQEQKVLHEAGEGQQAACLGDFNADGALDMALVLAKGEVWVFPRKVEDEALAAVVGLSASSPHAGPLSVTASVDKRQLGAWTIRAGGPAAVIGVSDPVPVTLKWRWPGSQVQTREVIVKNGPARVLLDKK
ncbi:MAG TPA: VCBS repeat-containing protein [Phycisphaerae bacterium]|nr:VCBS repeat-containing protein [Phycisphaerae bacterium]HUT58248.1 VCBS repeat-containing protein [Phycisphaerae bacterium]